MTQYATMLDEVLALRSQLASANGEIEGLRLWQRASLEARDIAIREQWRLEDELASAKKALKDIGEFCSGDQSPLGAIVRLGRVQSTARDALKEITP